jgi:hypothetical protein
MILNEICCHVYNKHDIYRTDGNSIGRRKLWLTKGDKIMVTKNKDIPLYIDDDDGESEQEVEKPLKTQNERLMNGSVYHIKDVQFS